MPRLYIRPCLRSRDIFLESICCCVRGSIIRSSMQISIVHVYQCAFKHGVSKRAISICNAKSKTENVKSRECRVGPLILGRELMQLTVLIIGMVILVWVVLRMLLRMLRMRLCLWMLVRVSHSHCLNRILNGEFRVEIVRINLR